MLTTFKSVKQIRSPLQETQKLKIKSSKKVGVKELVHTLPLTSLIDAFSIIVIYLLVGTQQGMLETPVPNLKLPVAENSQGLEKEVAILRIQNRQFFLNDQPISAKALVGKLAQLKKSSSKQNVELMVQADQNLAFAELDPLIKAGSLAGIEKLKFAVLPVK